MYETVRRAEAEGGSRTPEPGETPDASDASDELTDPSEELGALATRIATDLRAGRITTGDAADQLEAFRDRLDASSTESSRTEPTERTNAWDTVEGQKPDRSSIHVTETRRIHILDGDGLGNGGHIAGTGIPMKSEFPESWDDNKIIDAIEDVARNPDRPPALQRRGTWVALGTRDDVEIKTVVGPEGEVRTGYPLDGAGVIHNDEYGNPTITRYREA